MAKNSMKPRIRFKGFTDAWEQRKVGELLIERNEQTPKSDEYPLMAFIANEGVAPKGERYDRSSLINDTENKLYKRTEYGDFIYSSNNLETGSIGVNKYGNATISPVYSIFYTTELADSDFIGRRLIRKDFINEMVKWRQGVIYGQWRIHEDDFVKIKICVPKTCEQRKIGAILDNLDNLITLHQRKYDKIVNIKKALLEKMFPAEGEEVPKIRFKGFTEAWEQREFNSIAKRITEMTDTEDLPRVEYEDIVSGQGTLNKDINKKKSCKTGILFDNGDVLFGKLRPYLKNWLFATFMGIAVGDFWVLRANNADGLYIYTLLQIDAFQDIANQSTGTKMPRADWSLVSKQRFLTPTVVPEQRKIGEFFKQLDNLITLHQRQLEKLKNIKAALLEKMFV